LTRRTSQIGEEVVRGLTSYAALMPTFVQEVFKYITSVVPNWRVSDEAWLLEGDYLTGIGVERNYGGQVIVLPWDDDTRQQLVSVGRRLEPFLKRIAVVVDDRDTENVEAISKAIAPVLLIPWSHRAELASFVIKDTAN
jgi:hypothetical protein